MFPKITIKQDGDKVCVLYGKNLQEGYAGYGETADEAMEEFCLEYLNHRDCKERIKETDLKMAIGDVELFKLKRGNMAIVIEGSELNLFPEDLEILHVLIETYLKNFHEPSKTNR